MKKFIINILVFCIVFFLVEKLFYVFLYLSPFLECDKRLENVICGNIDKDLVILGSSRGARDILAYQIEDSLNISSYNLSYPGSDIEFHEFLLQSLIKFNKKPKIIILAVDDPSELLPSESIKFRLDRLYPLAKYDYINNEMIKRGEKSFLSNYLVLARFNKSNLNILQKRFNAVNTILECGSMPISFQRKGKDFIYKKDEYNYQIFDELPNKIESFLKLQSTCINNNIKLYIIFPPNYRIHNSSFEKRIKELSNSSVSFYVYDTANIIYQDKDYYYDESHLKKNGAIIFTDEIITHLKQNMRIK